MANLLQLYLSMSALAALVVSYFWFENPFLSGSTFLLVTSVFLYGVYYSICRRYSYKYLPKDPAVSYRGRIPPPFPNGWYVVARSEEVKPQTVKTINQSGYHIVLFRGEDGCAYALNAYCPHSGANLAIGGTVKYNSCVQCPFHGWIFDGKTGNLVSGEGLKPRKMQFYAYNEDFSTCKLSAEDLLKKTKEGLVSVRKYQLIERNGYIHLYLSADPSTKPSYEPIDFSDKQQYLPFKGTSLNKIFTHCQDIVENGGDIRHFIYVHSYLLPFTNIFTAKWEAKWLRGDDPELKTKMKHKIPWVDEHKQRLLEKNLNKENAGAIGIMSLDMYYSAFNCSHRFFFNATIFQVGPGLVYLFLISPFYEAVFFQHTTSLDKFEHDVYHQLYASSYLPHFFTALMLRLEAEQVTNDTGIWNNKIFASEPIYNTESEADATIVNWRRWFGQFYEGCGKAEAEKNRLSW